MTDASTPDPEDSATPARLSVQTRLDGDTVVVAIAGELDPHTATELTDAVAGQLDHASLTTVTIDLADVAFIDSTGLRAVLSSQRMVQDRGLRFVLSNPSAATQRLLTVTQLVDHLDIES